MFLLSFYRNNIRKNSNNTNNNYNSFQLNSLFNFKRIK